MPGLIWTPLATFNQAPGQIGAPWVVALEEFPDMTLLRFQATGDWTPVMGMPDCGPDGLPGSAWPDAQLLVTGVPLGALIGRIGGSSASIKLADGDLPPAGSKPFAVGSYAVIKVPEKPIGPVFLGINVTLRPVQVRAMDVTISGARYSA